jgi:hypothetical protein
MAMAGSVAVSGPQDSDELLRSIVDYASAVNVDTRVGVPAKPARITLAPAGVAVSDAKGSEAYRWGEVQEVGVRRGTIVLRTEAPRERVIHRKAGVQLHQYVQKRGRAVRVMIDGVEEPTLVPAFARILEDMRTGKFTYNGTSWIDFQNAHDRLQTEFNEQDDAVLPAAAALLWLSVGLLAAVLVPVALNVAAARAVPTGAFAISDKLGVLDPRSVIAGLALSALFASVILRLALGRPATIWIRGAARGWARRDNGGITRIAIRQLGRTLLATSSAAVIFLLALLTFWPNVAATVLVSPAGVRHEVLLPFISLDEPWRNTVQVTRDSAGVTIRFADGRVAGTIGHELGGGTESQLYEYSNIWWKAAR